jgi:hypothetical protein
MNEFAREVIQWLQGLGLSHEIKNPKRLERVLLKR